MKYFVIFSLLLILTLPSFAEVYLRDVPEGSWAYDAVYDLVKLGVTDGFPDGTFRGKLKITRFEVASFLSKFATSIRKKRGLEEKLIAELWAETSLLAYQRKKELQISGEFLGNLRAGRTDTSRGGEVFYRIKLQASKNFYDAASLKINLDTMDSGFNGGSRNFSEELLDLEGKVKLGRATLKVTSGPGDIVHADDPLFPFENNMRYQRPKRTISVSSSLANADFSLDYISRSTASSGLIETAEVSSKLSYAYPFFKFIFNPRYFYNTAGQRDLRLDLGVEIGSSLGILVGMAKTADFPRGLYVKGEAKLGNLSITAQRIGSQFRETFSYSIFDLFDRPLPDGMADVALKFSQSLRGSLFLNIKTDLTLSGDYKYGESYPGTSLTTEIGFGCNATKNTSFQLIYVNYQVPSAKSSDALGIKISCAMI